MWQKLAILSSNPKVHHPLDNQHHSKDCHLPQNKNLSMRLHYDLCRTSFDELYLPLPWNQYCHFFVFLFNWRSSYTESCLLLTLRICCVWGVNYAFKKSEHLSSPSTILQTFFKKLAVTDRLTGCQKNPLIGAQASALSKNLRCCVWQTNCLLKAVIIFQSVLKTALATNLSRLRLTNNNDN